MYKATFQVTGVTDLMFGKHVPEKKKDSETHEQREERLWKKKVPVTGDGQCYMNPFAVTNGLVTAAKWLKRKVDGRSGYTGRFQSGVSPSGKILLFKLDGSPLTIDDVEPIPLFVPSSGKKGEGTRVFRIFPTVQEWIGRGSVIVFDGKIPEDQLYDHLVALGQFVGWGSMRVEGGGINGRFRVDDLQVEEMA